MLDKPEDNKYKSIADKLLQQEETMSMVLKFGLEQFKKQGRGCVFGLLHRESESVDPLNNTHVITIGRLELRYFKVEQMLTMPIEDRQAILRKVMSYHPDSQVMAYLGVVTDDVDGFFGMLVALGKGDGPSDLDYEIPTT